MDYDYIDNMIEDSMYKGTITGVVRAWKESGMKKSFDDFCFDYTGVIHWAFSDDRDYDNAMDKVANLSQ